MRAVFAGFLGQTPTTQSTLVSEVIVGDIALLQADWQVIAPDGSVLAKGRSTEIATRLAHGGLGYLIDCPNGPPPCS